jgi:hypothetical protein
MELIELLYRKTSDWEGGRRDEAVGNRQREWTISEAGTLIMAGKALFFYRGARVTDLSVLPDVQV